MVNTKRDPSIGKEWLAWWALQGDEPLDCIPDYLRDANEYLGDFLAANRDELTPDDHHFFAGLRLALIGLAGAARGDGSTEYKLDFKRARRGKPINKMDRALQGNGAASWVEREIEHGKQQEQAVLEAVEQFGLSRAEIFSWLKHQRAIRRRANSSNSQD